MLTGTRFRRPTAEDAKHVTEFLNAGKPVIGIRTATHAFTGGGSFGGKISYGAFGPLIMGEGWVSHHGRHKVEGARGVIESKNAKHPILNGVKDVFGPSERLRNSASYRQGYHPSSGRDRDPGSKVQKRRGQEERSHATPRMAASLRGTQRQGWYHFLHDHGASVDLVSEDLRRLVVNACYHLTGLDVPKKAGVGYVDPFYPSFYGFIRDKEFWPGQDMQPADYGLGKTPNAPEPKGSPKWPWRDSPEK